MPVLLTLLEVCWEVVVGEGDDFTALCLFLFETHHTSIVSSNVVHYAYQY